MGGGLKQPKMSSSNAYLFRDAGPGKNCIQDHGQKSLGSDYLNNYVDNI